MKFFFAIEKFLVRYFGVSLISYIVCRQAKVPLVATFMLITTGRKSGRRIDTPIFYFVAGDAYYVIASKGGAPTDPAWFLNLTADPKVEFQVGDKKYRGRAGAAEGAERERLFAMMAKIFPAYNDYKARTSREIPVVLLQPEGEIDRL